MDKKKINVGQRGSGGVEDNYEERNDEELVEDDDENEKNMISKVRRTCTGGIFIFLALSIRR